MILGFGPALASFALCLLAIFALRPLAIAVDLIDRPGGRKRHHGEVPIVGGLAMFLGATLGIGLLPLPESTGAAFLAACAILVTVGLLDDRFDVSPWMRLPAQLAAAVLLMFGSGTFVTTLGSPLGAEPIQLEGLVSYAFTVLIVMAAINAFNMLDGMDGLAGTTAVIALAALAFLAGSGHLILVMSVCLVFIGAVIAFLIFNLPTRLNREVRCFMGDAGSTLLGFAIAWLCIKVSQGPRPAAAPVTTLWVVALPLYELLWSTVRRIMLGVSPFKADDNHFHHLLLKAGFGVRGAFGIFVILGSLLALVGVLLEVVGVPESCSFLLLILTGIGVVRLMYRAEMLRRLVPDSLFTLPPLEPVKQRHSDREQSH